MTYNLQGKVAIVLGVSNGNIGQTIARHFAKLNAEVVIAGRKEADVKRIGNELGVQACRCDITVAQDLDDLAAFAIGRYGHVNVAINSVGINLVRPFLDVTRDELDLLVKTQFIGTYLFLQSMIRVMETGGGSIIQMSSVTSQAVLPDHAVYMASKAAGDMLVRSAAFDFGHRNIRVNSLSPGATLDAPMAGEIMKDPAERAKLCDMVPLRRVGTCQDVADAAAWLASDHCFMTGENLQINGGIAIPALSAPPSAKTTV